MGLERRPKESFQDNSTEEQRASLSREEWLALNCTHWLAKIDAIDNTAVAAAAAGLF